MEKYNVLPIPYVLYGDVNCDGVIDKKDRTVLTNYINGVEGYESAYCGKIINGKIEGANEFIPITKMRYTFSGCIYLKTAPAIPTSVTNMWGTFKRCQKLTGTLEINASPESYNDCLYDVATDTSATLKITGSSTKLTEILNTKSSTSNISI